MSSPAIGPSSFTPRWAGSLAPPRLPIVVAAFCVAQVLLWSAAFGLTYSGLELDSAEQLLWGFSMEAGYWKHPPLPSWIMGALLAAFGPSLLLPFVAAQACIVTALALTWRLGCEFMSPQRSLVALALTSLVTYHNFSGDSFNHNTVLLPFQAATALMFFRATRTSAWHHWLLAGLFAGLSMLVKYAALLPIAGLLLYFAVDRRVHRLANLHGLALAAAVFVAVLLPHALWLQANDYLPWKYAASVATPLAGMSETLANLARFTMRQSLRLIPLAAAAWFVLRSRGDDRSAPAAPVAAPAPGDRLFLWIVGLAPLALTLGYGLVTHTAILSRWGSNAFLLSGWLLLDAVAHRSRAAPVRRALATALVVQVGLSAAVTVSKTHVATLLHHPNRANFPGPALAQMAQDTWRHHVGTPLRLMISTTFIGGNINAHSTRPIAVLIDGNWSRAPWVTKEAVQRCGALVLRDSDAGYAHSPETLNAFMELATIRGEWSLPWPDAANSAARDSERSRIAWGIIPPQHARQCEL